MQNKLVLFVVLCAFSGCTINDKDFQIKGVQSNPTIVAPIASGTLTIDSLLSNEDKAYIKIKPDGLLYVSYDQTLPSHDIRNLVDIPNLGNVITSVAVPAGTYPANVNDYNSTVMTRTIDMGISPEKLNEILFKAGTLSYNMSLAPANANFKYEVIIAIPEFTSNGVGFSKQVSGTGSFSLANYLYKNAVANANKFTLNLTLVIKKNTQSTAIAPGTNLNVTISLAGMDFTYIKGFFGDQVANPPAQTVAVDVFGNTLVNGSNVSFAQPSIDFTVVSDYGVPLTVTFAKLEARKQGSAVTMLTTPASPIAINSPASLGTSATTSVSVSNAKQIANFRPTQFYYQASGHINSGLASGSNFMADTSQMRIKLHAEIPLYGNASNIIAADTMGVDLSDLDQSKIDSASLKSSVTNELPLDASLQFFLTDAKYVFIDSLLTASQTGLIKASTVDSNGDLQTATVSDQTIKLQTDKISKIFKAKKIIVRAKMNTPKNASGTAMDVKFKSQYKINVKLGLRAKLKVNATF